MKGKGSLVDEVHTTRNRSQGRGPLQKSDHFGLIDQGRDDDGLVVLNRGKG